MSFFVGLYQLLMLVGAAATLACVGAVAVRRKLGRRPLWIGSLLVGAGFGIMVAQSSISMEIAWWAGFASGFVLAIVPMFAAAFTVDRLSLRQNPASVTRQAIWSFVSFVAATPVAMVLAMLPDWGRFSS